MIAQTTIVNKTTITADKKVDGKIVKEVFVIEGEAADQKLKELENDKSVINIYVEKQVEMRSDYPNSAEMQKMRKEVEVKISDIENESGKKAERREESVEVEADDHKEIKKYKMKIIENGKEEVIEWNGKGEMPAKMKKVMGDIDPAIIVRGEGVEGHKYKMIKKDGEDDDMMMEKEVIIMNEKNNNRVQIGVMISDVKGGIEILSFVDNSAAKEAGLEVGDVIIGVNSKTVDTIKDLVEALSPYKPGDVVTINYTSGDRILTKEVKLSKR